LAEAIPLNQMRTLAHRAFMVCSAVTDVVQSRLRQALASAYGDRLARAVLFGSRARGDARSNSDYDVPVFLHLPEGLWAESGHGG